MAIYATTSYLITQSQSHTNTKLGLFKCEGYGHLSHHPSHQVFVTSQFFGLGGRLKCDATGGIRVKPVPY